MEQTGVPVKSFRFRIFIWLTILLCGSCSSSLPLMILTDAPEMVAYAELFNAADSGIKAYVTYSASPEAELRQNPERYDLIFASSILDRELIEYFHNLGSLVSRNKIAGSELYPHLLESYRNQGRYPVIPAAFDLHIFMTKAVAKDRKQLTISFEEIMESNKDFSVFRNGSYSKMAFSPMWSTNLFYHYLENKNCEISSWGKESLNINTDKMISLLSEFKNRYRSAFPLENSRAEKVFREKYLYDHYANLLLSGRILYYDTEFSHWIKMQKTERDQFDFYYFCEDGKMTTEPNVVFFAIPKTSDQKRKAGKFIRWFFAKETQTALITESEKVWLNSFGIAGRLSSVIETNESALCTLYPDLVFHLPNPELIYGPGPKPIGWEQLTGQIFDPWVEQNLHSETISAYPAEAVQLWFAEHRQ